MYELLHHYYLAIIWITAIVFAAFGLYYRFARHLPQLPDFSFRSARQLYGLLAVISIALFWFVVHFGNRQFGAFDYSVLVDVGWRLANGQRPYIDFFCTLPPAFMLGAKYAFNLWGPFWDSQLYVTAIFTSGTFLWLFFLLDQMVPVRGVALLAAISVECLTNLLACFWWYNPIASVAAAVFLLSCVLYTARPHVISHQVSYVFSFFMLAMMKPNTAAPLLAGAVVVMLLSGKQVARTIVLTVLGTIGVIGFLALNHIPATLLAQSYRAAARSRGLSLFGIRNDTKTDLVLMTIFVVWLLAPFLLWPVSVKSRLAKREYSSVCLYLLLGLGPVVALFAMVTNGENKFVDMILLIIPGVILLFGKPEYGLVASPSHDVFRKFYIALLSTLALIGIYTGATRVRVGTIGPYFELLANRQTDNAFFPHLRTGPQMVGLLRDVRSVLDSRTKEPIFLGPRMEFAYAAFHLQSPKYLPIWWHPGTSFAESEKTHILSEWENRRFGTLIFFKDEFFYYGPEFMSILERDYVWDESYTQLTVLHLK